MSPNEVETRLRRDLGNGWRDEVVNGLRLAEAVCSPHLIHVVDAVGGGGSEVWAVAYDDSNRKEGFIVAYDPAQDDFVIAEHAPEGCPYIVGRHRNVRLAIAAL